MGGGEVLKKGLLIKSPPLDGGALKMWHKRWFILLSSKVLEYYKSDGGEQKGVINLEDCHSINSNLSHKRYKHVFNIETKERVYFLVAKSQSEMDAWVDALCRVCGLHTENTPVIATLPSTSSSKSKGPIITTPIYSTYTLATHISNNSYALPIGDSVYSLAAANNTDYDMTRKFKRDSAGISAGGPVSEARGSTSNRASAASGGSGVCDVAGNRLSETAFFSPRPGDNVSFLERADPLNSTRTEREVSPGHRAVSKARSVTLAPSLLTNTTPTGLEHRSHTHVSAYSSPHHSSGQILPNGTTDCEVAVHLPDTPHSADSVTHKLGHFKVSPTHISSTSYDQECAGLDDGYGVLSMPPPIDRSKKPQNDSPIQPPAIDRALKPGQSKTDHVSSSNSPDNTSEREHHWSIHESSPVPHTSVSDDGEGLIGKDVAGDDEQESQFKISEIPQVTVRSTHYTQVDFNPDERRPIPLPRKTSSASSTPTTLVPKPRRVAYTEVDLNATDHLHRQMTVREAERKALKEKQYVNVDRSGEVDDETDPDYYTHMRNFNFEDSDEPHYVSVRTNQKQLSQPPLVEHSPNDDVFSVEQKSSD